MNTDLLKPPVLLKVGIQLLPQKARVRTDDAIVIRIVVGRPLENVDANLLLRNLVCPAIQGALTDISQEFRQPWRAAKTGTGDDALHQASSRTGKRFFVLRRRLHFPRSTPQQRSRSGLIIAPTEN